jgi:hypothetical protein
VFAVLQAVRPRGGIGGASGRRDTERCRVTGFRDLGRVPCAGGRQTKVHEVYVAVHMTAS